MNIDKDKLKYSLSLEDVFSFVADLGGNPLMQNDYFIAQTICHNRPGEGSYKLYYYPNTHLFRCYTECSDSFDIFELTKKVKSKELKQPWSLAQAIYFVALYFGYTIESFDFENAKEETLQDWEIFSKYKKSKELKAKKIIELKHYNKDILKNLPQPYILPWIEDGISYDIMKDNHICYNPINRSVVIPHYDIDNNLIGIRERTLVKEDEVYGKYRPAVLAGQMYNHPLSFALYNLNNSKDNIKKIQKAIIFEGEKGCMQFATAFGKENDISVACCGSSLIAYQVKILLSLGVKEIIIAFDKQFKEIGDEEFKQWKKKLININKKFSSYVIISFLFDKFNLLKYKESPIDQGKDIFLKLYERRIIL